MAKPLEPDNLTQFLRKAQLRGESAASAAMLATALKVQEATQAKLSESGSTQRPGTKGYHYEPLAKGRPPRVISGDLRRSVTHQREAELKYRVGPASIPHRNYKPGWKGGATSGFIGWVQETEIGHPFLGPAAKLVMATVSRIWKDAFRIQGPS